MATGRLVKPLISSLYYSQFSMERELRTAATVAHTDVLSTQLNGNCVVTATDLHQSLTAVCGILLHKHCGTEQQVCVVSVIGWSYSI